MAKLSVDQSGQMVTAGKSSSERGTRSIVFEEGSFSQVLVIVIVIVVFKEGSFLKCWISRIDF